MTATNAHAQTGLPEATKRPCNECPWRRDAEPGFFGDQFPEQFAAAVYAGDPIACHSTVRVEGDDWAQPHLRQCAGAASFRSNTNRVPHRGVAFGPTDAAGIFTRTGDFLDYHAADSSDGTHLMARVLVDQLLTTPGDPTAVDEELTRWADDLGADRMAQVAVAALSVTFGDCMRRAS